MKVAAGALRWVLGLLLVAMVVLNVANAAGRHLFGRAISGSDELLVFSMVWIVFLGLVLVTADNRHLKLDLLEVVLGPRWRAVQAALVALLIALLCGYVALQSWAVLGRLDRIGQRSMAAGIPMVIPHAAVFLGLGLTALAAAGLAVRHAVLAFRPGGDGP